MVIGVCRLRLHLPGCASLKEKRGRLRPLLARLRREFEAAVAEVDLQDVWQSAEVALVVVANEAGAVERRLEHAAAWVERNWPDLEVEDRRIELR
jgi:uncharacterized protein YlxP (DUF503 family)